MADFSEDIAFAHHFIASRLAQLSHSIGVLLVLAMPVKTTKNDGKFN